MLLADTHIHLTDNKYSEKELSRFNNDPKLYYMLTLGVNLDDSVAAAKLADKYSKVYCAVGVHPHEAEHFRDEDLSVLSELIDNNPKVVCVGEIGLDFFYDFSDRKIQQFVFDQCIELAKQKQIPASIHSRSAEKEVLEQIKSIDAPFICHSYTGDPELIGQYLDLGGFFSINGMITFKKNENIRDILDMIPVDRLLLETDGPYLTPVPHRGKMNEPAFVSLVFDHVLKYKKVSREVLAEQIQKNVQAVFKLK
jgi:TatD DNase family protein